MTSTRCPAFVESLRVVSVVTAFGIALALLSSASAEPPPEVEGRKLLEPLATAHVDDAESIFFAESGRAFAVRAGLEIHVFETDTTKRIGTVDISPIPEELDGEMALMRRGRVLLVSTSKGFRLYDVASGELEAESRGDFRGVVISPDRKHVAVVRRASEDDDGPGPLLGSEVDSVHVTAAEIWNVKRQEMEGSFVLSTERSGSFWFEDASSRLFFSRSGTELYALQELSWSAGCGGGDEGIYGFVMDVGRRELVWPAKLPNIWEDDEIGRLESGELDDVVPVRGDENQVLTKGSSGEWFRVELSGGQLRSERVDGIDGREMKDVLSVNSQLLLDTDEGIYVWTAPQRAQPHAATALTESAKAYWLTLDGERVLVRDHRTWRIHDIDTHETLGRLPASPADAMSPHGTRMATLASDGEIAVYELD